MTEQLEQILSQLTQPDNAIIQQVTTTNNFFQVSAGLLDRRQVIDVNVW